MHEKEPLQQIDWELIISSGMAYQEISGFPIELGELVIFIKNRVTQELFDDDLWRVDAIGKISYEKYKYANISKPSPRSGKFAKLLDTIRPKRITRNVSVANLIPYQRAVKEAFRYNHET